MSPDRNIEPTPLPRGRHGLSREHVLESQRERLLRAVFEVVAERGYASTTVADVVSAARVSRNAFYELFADKEACFLAACDQAGTQMVDELLGFAAEATWIDALRSGLRAYLAWWSERPWYATAYLVELPAAGRAAVEQRDRIYERFTGIFEALALRARQEQSGLPPLAPLTPRLIVTATTEIVGQEARAGRIAQLPQLEDDLLRLVVGLLADDRTAERAIGRAPRRRSARAA